MAEIKKEASNPDGYIRKDSPASSQTENTFFSKSEGDRWDKRITGALTLITIGIVLFLNTTGLLSWTVWWEFIKFWPLFIVSLGIQLILNQTYTTKVIAEFIGFGIFILALFFAAVNTNSSMTQGLPFSVPRPGVFPFINWQTDNNAELTKEEAVTVSEFPEVSSLELNIDQGIGEMLFAGEATDNTVYFNAEVYSPSGRDGFDLKKDLDGSSLELTLKSKQNNNWFFNTIGPSYSYTLSNNVRISLLNLKLGAGQGVVDLNNGLDISRVKLDTGAGDLTVNLERGSLPEDMEMKVGAGNMVINIPAEVAYRIDYNVGVGNLSMEGVDDLAGLGKDGSYTSGNWEGSSERVIMRVDVGVGNFKLNIK